MERIIDGFLYEGKKVPNTWDFRIWESNGHREISARQAVVWHEAGPAPRDVSRMGSQLDSGGLMVFGGPGTPEEEKKWAAQDADEAEKRRMANLKRSAGRAKTTCRRVIKAEGFDEMLTLSYRENMTDLDIASAHLKEWVRRMKKALPGFRYCGAREPQKRGAIHWHVMTHRLPKHAFYKGVQIKAFELGTRIWRDVIGKYPFQGPLQPGHAWPDLDNGMCFVGGKNRHGVPARGVGRSVASMAAYVTAYITKCFEEAPEGKNRYSRSNGAPVARPVTVRVHDCDYGSAVKLGFWLEDGDRVVTHTLGPWRDSYWLVTEPDIVKRPPVQ